MCPSANQRPEFEKRLDQAKEYAKKVQTTRFYVHEAWTALTVNVLPSITYSFPITRFTKAQLLRLSRVVDNVFLPKLGVNRKMKRIAVYAPLEYGGINYPSIETIQDQKGIGLVMRQLQLGKDISQDLRILIQTAQLESGMTTPILDDTIPRLPYMEPGHIMHLRDRLRELDGSILVIEDIWYPTLQRERDESIMGKLAQLPGISKRELEHANQCRKYIKVITIAEMASICGRYIPPNRFNGKWRAKS